MILDFQWVLESTRFQRAMSFIKSHRFTIANLVLILLVGMLPITWFTGGLLINRGDFDFSLSPKTEHFFYAWESLPPGVENTRHFAEIPYRSLIAFLGSKGISLVTLEKIYFVILFAMTGLSMYYLTLIFVKGGKRNIMVAIRMDFFEISYFNIAFAQIVGKISKK